MIEDVYRNDTYLITQKRLILIEQINQLLGKIKLIISKNYFPSSEIKKYLIESEKYLETVQNQVNIYNESFIEKRIKKYDYLFKNLNFFDF